MYTDKWFCAVETDFRPNSQSFEHCNGVFCLTLVTCMTTPTLFQADHGVFGRNIAFPYGLFHLDTYVFCTVIIAWSHGLCFMLTRMYCCFMLTMVLLQYSKRVMFRVHKSYFSRICSRWFKSYGSFDIQIVGGNRFCSGIIAWPNRIWFTLKVVSSAAQLLPDHTDYVSRWWMFSAP